MHPQFIVGEEIGDSTTEQRGKLADPPPERLHHWVVTGPMGDTLTSFCSCEEFVKCSWIASTVSLVFNIKAVLIQLLSRARIYPHKM